MTSKKLINGWIERGIDNGKAYMIVVCDTFDYEDYPAYADDFDELKKKYEAYNGKDMQRVMEIYDLNGDIDEQLAQGRAFIEGLE